MKILYAASEAAPFSQSGGLGDVAGSLPTALAEAGHEVAVITPLYDTLPITYREEMEFLGSCYVTLAWRRQYCGLFLLRRQGVDWYFLDNEYYFARGGCYGYEDDGERFAFFSKAVITVQQHFELYFDVLHANDWHTALIPVYLKTIYRDSDGLRDQRTVFTIHNIAYQGQYDPYILGGLFGMPTELLPLMEYDGCINIMKAAIICCDALTTVSPTYAAEIAESSEISHRLAHIIRSNSGKLSGIINGIDTDEYNPQTDPMIKSNFSASNLRGKPHCKAALRESFGLSADSDAPVIGMVGRLVDHKGLDIVCRAFEGLMQRDLQFVLLGSGDPGYQAFFNDMAARYPQKCGVWIGFSAPLARTVYAGSDIFLMPSKSEPCGLAQLIAMRYGAVPIVHQTGGLSDTVTDCRLGEGNGFCFSEYSESDLLATVDAALALYKNNKTGWSALRKYSCGQDFGWQRSAAEYCRLYAKITG